MNRGLYAGSFDPITLGHLDVIERAAGICDELMVGIFINSSKTPLFSVDERFEMIYESTRHLDNVNLVIFDGLLADFVLQNDINMVIRGLRGTSDFDYEIQMAQMNARLYNKKAETVFLMTDPANSFISSSMVKEVYSLGGSIEGLVPPAAIEYMKTKFNK